MKLYYSSSIFVIFLILNSCIALFHSGKSTKHLASREFKKKICKSNIVCYNVAPTTSAAINIAAIKAMSKLISTCGIGVFAGKYGLLDSNALGVLSKLIFSLFQPCLLFTNVASTVAKLSEKGTTGGSALIILPVVAILQIFLGYIVGKLMSLIIYGTNSDSEKAKTLIACSTFANSGPLPLVFTDCLFQHHHDKTLLTRSVAYISLYLLGWSPGFWIGAPAILMEKDNSGKIETKTEKMKALVNRIFSPPVLGSLLGLITGSIPFLRHVLISQHGLLNPIFESMRTLGAAYLPLVLMVLAGSLSSSLKSPSSSSTVTTTTTISTNDDIATNKTKQLLNQIDASKEFAIQVVSVYFIRFLLFPSLAFTISGLASKYIPSVRLLFKNDPLLLLILLLETCMPSAQNTTVVLQLQNKKDAAGRLAKLLLALYVLGIPAMSYWLVKILLLTGLA